MVHTQAVGTPGYIADEVRIGKAYNTKDDIYSLGKNSQTVIQR